MKRDLKAKSGSHRAGCGCLSTFGPATRQLHRTMGQKGWHVWLWMVSTMMDGMLMYTQRQAWADARMECVTAPMMPEHGLHEW